MYIGTCIDGITGCQALPAPLLNGMHDSQCGGLPVKQGRALGDHHGMHQVTVQLHHLRQGVKIALQDSLPALRQALFHTGEARDMQWAGVCQGVAMEGAGLFVLLADDRHAVRQIPVIRGSQAVCVRILVAVPWPPLDKATRHRAASRARATARQAESSDSLSSRPAARLEARLRAAKAEAEEAIPAPVGKLFSLSTWANHCMPESLRTWSRNWLTRCSAAPDERLPFRVSWSEGRLGKKVTSGPRGQPLQVHGNRTVGRDAQDRIAIPQYLMNAMLGLAVAIALLIS